MEDIPLGKGEISGFFESSIVNLNDLTTETFYKTVFQDEGYYLDLASSILGDYFCYEVKNIQKKKFIPPPAKIEVHCKVDLKDATVDEEHKEEVK